MSYYRYRIEGARNNLWRDKERYRIKENNLKRLYELENKIKLLENELLKIKAEGERNLIREKNYQEEKELKQKNSAIKNIHEFDQFLLDNKLKSELEKKRNENNNEINLKQMKNDYNLKSQNLSNVHKENLEELKLKKEKIENKLENKIKKLDLEKQKADNENEKNKINIEYEKEEELMKKKQELKSILNEIEKEKIEIENKTKEKIEENNKNTICEEFRLKSELLIKKEKNEIDKENKLNNIEYNKMSNLFNQEFEKEKDNYNFNIMMQQMIAMKMMQNNATQENS